MESKAKTRLAKLLNSPGGRAAVQFMDHGRLANLPVASASMPPVGSLATCRLLEIGWVVVGWSDDEAAIRKQVDRNLRSVFC